MLCNHVKSFLMPGRFIDRGGHGIWDSVGHRKESIDEQEPGTMEGSGRTRA